MPTQPAKASFSRFRKPEPGVVDMPAPVRPAHVIRRALAVRPYYISIGKIKPRDWDKLYEPAVGPWPVLEQGPPLPEWDPIEFFAPFNATVEGT